VAKSSAKPQSSGKSSPGKSSSAKAPATKAKAPAPAIKARPIAKAAPTKPNSAVKAKKAPAAAPLKAAPVKPVKVAAVKVASAKRHVVPAAQPATNHSVPIPHSMLPMPTDGKPRKNQAGLNARELLHFREQLIAKRRELVGDVSSMEREALRTSSGTNLSTLPMHMADMGTDNYEQEFTLGLVEKDRGLLREINSALQKMLTGVYGLCEGTGKPITKARLEAQPWARFSIEYARQMERGHRIL
jgi:DnaK suppressor protein